MTLELKLMPSLPVITDEIFDHFKDTDLIEIEDGKPNWTQEAVDFACVLPIIVLEQDN